MCKIVCVYCECTHTCMCAHGFPYLIRCTSSAAVSECLSLCFCVGFQHSILSQNFIFPGEPIQAILPLHITTLWDLRFTLSCPIPSNFLLSTANFHSCTMAYVKSVSTGYSGVAALPTYNHLRVYWKKQVNCMDTHVIM